MVQVIEMKSKEVVCYKCESHLSYVASDVIEVGHTDYTGDRETYKMIICPVCSNKVIVK